VFGDIGSKHPRGERDETGTCYGVRDGVMQAPGGPEEDPTRGFQDGQLLGRCDCQRNGIPAALKLVDSKASPSGVTISSYQRDGAVKPGSFALEKPSADELARRERLQREG
jgi:hypothetical protein